MNQFQSYYSVINLNESKTKELYLTGMPYKVPSFVSSLLFFVLKNAE